VKHIGETVAGMAKVERHPYIASAHQNSAKGGAWHIDAASRRAMPAAASCGLSRRAMLLKACPAAIKCLPAVGHLLSKLAMREAMQKCRRLLAAKIVWLIIHHRTWRKQQLWRESGTAAAKARKARHQREMTQARAAAANAAYETPQRLALWRHSCGAKAAKALEIRRGNR